MKSYKFTLPTTVYFGTNCVKEQADVLCSFGKKAFIVTMHFLDGRRNHALDDVISIFEERGIEYLVNSDTEENPPVEVVDRITKIAREYDPDFIVGIGGGSAMDTAKAVNCQLEYPADMDPYKVFYGSGSFFGSTRHAGKLPSVAIPTTAGTAAEVTAGAVLTRADTDTKDSVFHKLYYTVTFLDARYVEESPSFLIHTGVMDALAHGVEAYVNTRSNFMNRAMGEIGFKLFSEFKDNLINDCLTYEDFEKMIIAANVFGMSFAQSGTTIPHGMGYPLSHFKQLNHGLSCSITMGEYMRGFKDTSKIQTVVELCGFKDVNEFADYVNEIIRRDVHIEVTREEISQWTDSFCLLKDRFARHPEPLSRDEVEQIYLRSLAPYIVD